MKKKKRKTGKPKKVKRKNKRRSIVSVILSIIISVVLVAVIFAAANVLFYLAESNYDSSNPYPVAGVDVSEFQKEINWKGLEKEGYRFAFIKATEGSSLTDSNFEYNWKEANKTGMKVGAYHFLSYDSEGSGQADNYIRTVDRKWGMMPPVVDVEFYGKYLDEHPTQDKVYEILDVVLDKLEDKYKKVPIIYTNKYIYNNYISGKYNDNPVWISDPDISDTLDDGRKWLFCQYSFRGVSPNIADGQKYVDLNLFNGSEWEFIKYTGR